MPQRPCLVLTRPQPLSARFADQARQAGWRGDIVIAPLLEIVLHPLQEGDFADARTLVVTSQHAVSALVQATDRRDWVIWAVGPRTAEVAREAGFLHIHQSGGDAKALLDDLTQAPPPAPIVHVRGHHAAADIAAALQAQGQEARSVVGYEQVSCDLSAVASARLRAGGDIVTPVFSPRSARLLAQAVQECGVGATRLHLVGISAAAIDALGQMPMASCHIAARPDAGSVCAALMSVQQTLEP
jgi:uroporphyrinogen-III synthase